MALIFHHSLVGSSGTGGARIGPRSLKGNRVERRRTELEEDVGVATAQVSGLLRALDRGRPPFGEWERLRKRDHARPEMIQIALAEGLTVVCEEGRRAAEAECAKSHR